MSLFFEWKVQSRFMIGFDGMQWGLGHGCSVAVGKLV
jgi:hypothetical protein